MEGEGAGAKAQCCRHTPCGPAPTDGRTDRRDSGPNRPGCRTEGLAQALTWAGSTPPQPLLSSGGRLRGRLGPTDCLPSVPRLLATRLFGAGDSARLLGLPCNDLPDFSHPSPSELPHRVSATGPHLGEPHVPCRVPDAAPPRLRSATGALTRTP